MSRGKFYIMILLGTLYGVFHTGMVFSQLSQPNRFEHERKTVDEDFTIISLKEEGLALVRETNKYKAGNRTWEVIVLDSTLVEKGVIEFDVNNQNRLVGYERSTGALHLLFQKNEINGYMDLLSVNLKSKNIDRYELKPEITYRLTHFYKVGENFILAGVVGREPAILIYSPSSDNIKVLPGIFQKQTELMDIQVNQNKTFNALLMDRANRDIQKVIFRTYDPIGKLLLEDVKTIDKNIELHSGICSTLEKEDLLVMGSWGKLNSKQANGFYAFPINPYVEQKIDWNYFGLLDHYLDYLKPKKAAAVREKTQKALEKGTTPEFINYIMPHRIIEHTQGFLLLAESFMPSSNNSQSSSSYYIPYFATPYKYNFPSHGDYNSRNSPYGNDGAPVQEIKSIQSVVVSFDNSGTILWDYSVKLDNIKRPLIEQVSDFCLDADSIHFLYKKDSEIRFKSINLKDGESIERTKKIRLNNSSDVVRMERSQVGAVRHWFGKNFYVWGYQSIRNNSKGDFRTREIFYINKLLVR
jgi:hypothetical protein